MNPGKFIIFSFLRFTRLIIYFLWSKILESDNLIEAHWEKEEKLQLQKKRQQRKRPTRIWKKCNPVIKKKKEENEESRKWRSLSSSFTSLSFCIGHSLHFSLVLYRPWSQSWAQFLVCDRFLFFFGVIFLVYERKRKG